MNVIKLTPPVRTKLLLQKAHWPEELGDCAVALVSAFKGNLVHWRFSSYCVHSSVHRGTWGQRRGQVHVWKEAGRVPLSPREDRKKARPKWARDEICILEDSPSFSFLPVTELGETKKATRVDSLLSLSTLQESYYLKKFGNIFNAAAILHHITGYLVVGKTDNKQTQEMSLKSHPQRYVTKESYLFFTLWWQAIVNLISFCSIGWYCTAIRHIVKVKSMLWL